MYNLSARGTQIKLSNSNQRRQLICPRNLQRHDTALASEEGLYGVRTSWCDTAIVSYSIVLRVEVVFCRVSERGFSFRSDGFIEMTRRSLTR